MTFSSSSPAGIGIVGCGNISERYVKGISRFPLLKTLGCADMYQEAADKLSASTAISAYPSVDALLDDPGVDVVVNITSPVAHAEVSFAALKAGKHVYVEKPMGATVAEGRRMIEAAVAAGRVLGSAPDTFLGSSAQTARAAVDKGVIGEPIGAVGFVTHSKAETWHPDPTFLFKPGGGPVLDLGPYYVTALGNLLGPVASVAGLSRVGAPVRTVSAPGRRVDKITVEVPTHAVASLEFASGALATMMFSFDVWDHHLPYLEIYGQEGALGLFDPNKYDGPVVTRGHHDSEWATLPPVFPPSAEPGSPEQFMRGPGVVDLVRALDGAPHRASAALALHVLEVLQAVETASQTRQSVGIESRVERPATVPADPKW